MIEIEKLTKADKGREVRYRDSHAGVIEYGKITSWNADWIFVLYHSTISGGKRTARTGETSEASRPEDLEFVQ